MGLTNTLVLAVLLIVGLRLLVLLVPQQWAVLLLVPVLTLVVGSALVQALDRRAHLIELGRTAEREATTTAGQPPA